MKPEDCKPGTRVYYQPTVGAGLPKYAGVVRSEPWQLAHGTWVTHIDGMDPAYGTDTGRPGRTSVHAAVVEHLELRSAEAGAPGSLSPKDNDWPRPNFATLGRDAMNRMERSFRKQLEPDPFPKQREEVLDWLDRSSPSRWSEAENDAIQKFLQAANWSRR